MINTSSCAQSLTTFDGLPLKEKLRRAERRRKIKAAGLVAPLFFFLLITFLIPILLLLYRAVENPEILEVMPLTAEAIQSWDGSGIPGEPVFAALAADLRQASKDRTVGNAGKRLNYDITGFRSMLIGTARKISKIKTEPDSYRDTILGIDKRWGEVRYWAAVRRAATPYTDFYLLASIDLERDSEGNIIRQPKERALYIRVFVRTFWMSFVVTIWCLLLGYPVAWMLASLPVRYSNLLMILVLLPFWTSLLVRTASWIIVLQKEGIINKILLWTHLSSDPLQLVFNRFGVYVAMIHILLPFMILPLYSVMKNIPPSYMRAASSLGANPIVAFLKVYLPQSMPGISAGCLLVYILAIGYYITPALVGGPKDQMLSYFIAFFTNNTINWGMASGLAVLLLAATIVLYIVFNRFIGVERLRMG
ncbi:MAG: ABC transporter permease [Desulfobacterales bacterium]|nr:MAG: ABC transporter permease [Desulfobacterales bacterium]